MNEPETFDVEREMARDRFRIKLAIGGLAVSALGAARAIMHRDYQSALFAAGFGVWLIKDVRDSVSVYGINYGPPLPLPGIINEDATNALFLPEEDLE